MKLLSRVVISAVAGLCSAAVEAQAPGGIERMGLLL